MTPAGHQISPHHWLRFTRYVIRDGYVVPGPDAAVRIYEPWRAFVAARAKGQLPAYESLVRLVHTAPGGQVHGADLVAWCSRNGLLGALLADARRVYVARDPEHVGDASRHDAGFIEYRHRPQGWQATDLKPHPRRTGVAFRKSVAPAHTERLAETWGKFFPTVAPADKERQPYPLPSSDAFWCLYAEPVARFTDEARWVRDGITELADLLRHKTRGEALKASAFGDRLSPNSPSLHNHNIVSLLSAYAAMIAHDLLSGRTPTECGRCSMRFLARGSARSCGYCS